MKCFNSFFFSFFICKLTIETNSFKFGLFVMLSSNFLIEYLPTILPSHFVTVTSYFHQIPEDFSVVPIGLILRLFKIRKIPKHHHILWNLSNSLKCWFEHISQKNALIEIYVKLKHKTEKLSLDTIKCAFLFFKIRFGWEWMIWFTFYFEFIPSARLNPIVYIPVFQRNKKILNR